MLKAIELGEAGIGYLNEKNKQLYHLYNLSKINIFIGENNCGKSRLLRNIIKCDTSKAVYCLSEEYSKHFARLKNDLFVYINKYNNYPSCPKEYKIVMNEEVKNSDDNQFYCLIYELVNNLGVDLNSFDSTLSSYYSEINNLLRNMSNLIMGHTIKIKKIKELDVTYIPILRGIESFNKYFNLKKSTVLDSVQMNSSQREALEEYKSNAKSIYSNKVSGAYNIDKGYIFTAENLFDVVEKKLLGEETSRQFIRDFENFISTSFFNNEVFNIIPQIEKGYLNVKMNSSQDRALHDLGDGIKQLITILYKMFENRNKEAYFFIEEPELNLHPGYQRKFLEILKNYEPFKKHQVFITTHSNHMIDLCLTNKDVSIYKFINTSNKNNSFKVINTTNDDVEILEQLGVFNSSVFLSNCTIWVEGISDKILLSKYLEVYLKFLGVDKYKEDIHYSFVEYGGNNITHWAFIPDDNISTINSSGITKRCMVIVDNDNNSKRPRKKKLRQILGDNNFYEYTVREIENTLTKSVLDKTLFGDETPRYKKDFRETDFHKSDVYMGSFIDEHYDLNRKYCYGGSGTITKKLEFALDVIPNINSIDDLSIQAKRVCKKIYNFIVESNK